MGYTINDPAYTAMCYNCGEPVYQLTILHDWLHKDGNTRECPKNRRAAPLRSTLKENRD